MVNMARILAADDEMDIRMILEAVLMRHGEVDVVSDGQEAIDKLVKAQEEQKPYDAVVTDLRMPKKDGFAVLDYIRENYGNTPVIVLSANAKPEDNSTLESKGAFVIQKPFENKAVFRAVEYMLSGNSEALEGLKNELKLK
jgi:CheY-like chemotaxis protein